MRTPRWTRLRALASAIVAVAAVAACVVAVAAGDRFDSGSNQQVTVTVACWRASVEVDGRDWVSPSDDPVPAAWGLGPEPGFLTLVHGDEAVFTSAADSGRVKMWGGQFHDAGCPLQGRS